MMKNYTFYEALKEVMENSKQFVVDNIKMYKELDLLKFVWVDTGLNCHVQRVTDYYAESVWTEYEPPVDWSKVAVDTKIEVSDNGVEWHKKHFSCFDAGLVRAFTNGQTSFTSTSIDCCWKYARLYKE